MPCPNVIFGLLSAQGFTPLGHEIMRTSLIYKEDERLLSGKHVKDVKPTIPSIVPVLSDENEEGLTPCVCDLRHSMKLKRQVNDLEIASRIVSQ